MDNKTFYKDYPKYQLPYLVQRLLPPVENSFGGKVRIDQVFAFGGGGSGLSNEAWEILKPLFTFDYMGAAEFEFGAFPKSLKPFSESKLVAYSIKIQGKNIKQDKWERERILKKTLTVVPPPQDQLVYIICRRGDEDFVDAAIRQYAKDEYAIDPKERVGLSQALDPLSDYDRKTCGWYELRNGFFFFTDKGMWERTRDVFIR